MGKPDFRLPPGVKDILPEEIPKWHYLEDIIRELAKLHRFREIRTPIFEMALLFQRGVGEATDIVVKEMYLFKDRGGRELALRPEGTAPVARAYVEHGLHTRPQPLKLYYVGPMFRHDRPQMGRNRQFHQFGAEIFGAPGPAADAEVIFLLAQFLRRAGVREWELELNSVGCPVCRPQLVAALKEYLEGRASHLCPDCRQRLERNPLRVLDCKEESCRQVVQQAPTPLDYLCSRCESHFRGVQEELYSLEVPFRLNPRLVRGLDYYTGTTFEVLSPRLGAQNALGGGGRYDYLVEECGGPPTPGVGFAVGLERVLLALERQEDSPLPKDEVRWGIFVVAADEEGRKRQAYWLKLLRSAGLPADRDYASGRGLRAQLKQADRHRARWALILGAEELGRGMVRLRDLESGEQVDLPEAEVIAWLRQKETGGS
ncbi:histidine--tRNA ligase [Ammonifex thiophilus]|uniref:Histidine--tRNA ligase n=1 Tax=Ammonifex thiophilus TaxID=444093 RepID=A0A3D8P3W9_9THEO|nr:histidine--tRNA ligase [Ammonifex thiophilus]RDV82506.1 histidine--tRNA ligase [Ammonifex thiophilus]